MDSNKTIIFLILLLLSCSTVELNESQEEMYARAQQNIGSNPRAIIRNVDLLSGQVAITAPNLTTPTAQGIPPDYLILKEIVFNGRKFRYIRVGDADVFGGDDFRVRNSYAKIPFWNSDGSLIKTATTNRKVLHGAKRFSVTQFPSGIGQRWSNTSPTTLYSMDNGDFYIHTLDLANRSVSANLVRQFSDYTSMDWAGGDECKFDKNDKYAVFWARKAANTNTWLVVYDLQLDTIISETDLGAGVPYEDGVTLDYATMSPNGDYVLVNYFVDGAGATQGVKVYENNVGGGSLDSLTHLIDYSEHGDVAIDQSGNQVYVSYDGTTVVGYDVSMVRLDTGATTGLFPTGLGLQGGHISYAMQKEGWVLLNPQGSGTDASRKIIWIKLDGTETMMDWGGTYNDNINSNHACYAVPSPDGSKVLFGSNWDDTTLEALSVAPAWVMFPVN